MTNVSKSELIIKIKKLRSNYALQRNVPAYVIFHDSTLNEIVNKMPIDKKTLKNISGVGPYFIDHYSDQILDIIREYKFDTRNSTDMKNLKNRPMDLSFPIKILKKSNFDDGLSYRRYILNTFPNPNDALREKIKILDEYIWSFQPRDMPLGFTFDLHYEIFENVLTEINDENAIVLYWFFLYFYNNLYSQKNAGIIQNSDLFKGFYLWYKFLDDDYYLHGSGSYYISKEKIDRELKILKVFFDNHNYAWITGFDYRRLQYLKINEAKACKYSHEGYELIEFSFLKENYKYANIDYSACFLEVFLGQKDYIYFSEFYKKYKIELEELENKIFPDYSDNNEHIVIKEDSEIQEMNSEKYPTALIKAIFNDKIRTNIEFDYIVKDLFVQRLDVLLELLPEKSKLLILAKFKDQKSLLKISLEFSILEDFALKIINRNIDKMKRFRDYLIHDKYVISFDNRKILKLNEDELSKFKYDTKALITLRNLADRFMLMKDSNIYGKMRRRYILAWLVENGFITKMEGYSNLIPTDKGINIGMSLEKLDKYPFTQIRLNYDAQKFVVDHYQDIYNYTILNRDVFSI